MPAVVLPAAATDQAPTDGATILQQSVLGESAFGPGFELPATDTVADVTTGRAPLGIILGLAGLAGAVALLAPSRRRKPDATE
jgi:hypothetical protein